MSDLYKYCFYFSCGSDDADTIYCDKYSKVFDKYVLESRIYDYLDIVLSYIIPCKYVISIEKKYHKTC